MPDRTGSLPLDEQPPQLRNFLARSANDNRRSICSPHSVGGRRVTPQLDARAFSSISTLRHAVASLDGHYDRGVNPTVRNLLEPLGPHASALGAAVLAIPFLSPVSLGPVTAPASMLIVLFGLQLLRRSSGKPLPTRLLAVPLPAAVKGVLAAVLTRVDRVMSRFSRPRLNLLVDGRRGRMICGFGVICGALLLAIPIPLLPLTNTVPSFAILCFGLGLTERDGLMTLTGFVSLASGVALFAAFGTGVFVLAGELIRGLLGIVFG